MNDKKMREESCVVELSEHRIKYYSRLSESKILKNRRKNQVKKQNNASETTE